MPTPSPNPFSGACLDRRAETRDDPAWPQAALDDGGAVFLLAQGSMQLVRREPASIAYVDASHPAVRSASTTQLIQLGWIDGRRHVLVEVGDAAGLPQGSGFEELRPMLPLLSAAEVNLLSYARALQVWRARHRHCGVCGAPTQPKSAGHALACTSTPCGEVFFPRLDPAIIVLVSDGSYVLMGRQASWPPGRYSALAGFVEPGESLEDAVIREVREETGVEASAVSYFASQPWPFPSSLMLGFHATAQRGAIRLDGELENARWFHADELTQAPPAMLPPRHTIARHLIATWYAQATGRALPMN
ncbi:MAG: NAD(+) diphosphatase [Steroidobacteraceae bacterium]